MGRFILFDSGPLGLAVCRTGTKGLAEFGTRLAELEMVGVSILIPAVIDYEVRRELVRIGATAKLRKLEGLRERFRILPVSGAAWLLRGRVLGLVATDGASDRPGRGPRRGCGPGRVARPPWDGRAMRWSSRRATSATCRGSRASTRGSGSPSRLEGLGDTHGFAPRRASYTGHSPRSPVQSMGLVGGWVAERVREIPAGGDHRPDDSGPVRISGGHASVGVTSVGVTSAGVTHQRGSGLDFSLRGRRSKAAFEADWGQADWGQSGLGSGLDFEL